MFKEAFSHLDRLRSICIINNGSYDDGGTRVVKFGSAVSTEIIFVKVTDMDDGRQVARQAEVVKILFFSIQNVLFVMSFLFGVRLIFFSA